MKIMITTASPTNTGAINHTVEFDLPDDATGEQVEEMTCRALEAHKAVMDAQQEWAFERLTPEQQEELLALRAAVEEVREEAKVQPRPGEMATSIGKATKGPRRLQ